MNKNKSHQKTIVALFILIILFTLIPFRQIATKPTIIGRVISSVFIYGMSINSSCNISLIDDWNLISTQCMDNNNNSVQYLLSSTDYTSIHTYNSSDTTDPWKSYNPNLPTQYVQDLEKLDRRKGYWINSNANQSININGTRVWPDYIPLESGWNLIGYINNESNEVKEVLSTIEGMYSIVWTYNASSSSYEYYNPLLDSGNIEFMSPYGGYWIKMNSQTNWQAK